MAMDEDPANFNNVWELAVPNLQRIKIKVQEAHHIVVLSGAGMSQESGLPIYRGTDDGLWNQHVVTEVATAQALRNDPKKVWEWLEALAQTIRMASPNAGHVALAELERHCKVTVVTQNVDDLHERAGSTLVIHLHGSIFAYKCAACARAINLSTDPAPEWEVLREHGRCSNCNGHIRQDVVLFNEMLDSSRIAIARKAIRDCDVVLVVGTSNLIYPAAELPRYAMKRHKFVVEINPQETPISSWVSARVTSSAASALPELLLQTDHASDLRQE